MYHAVVEQGGGASTWPEARPLSTSRRIRSRTAVLAPVAVEGRDVQAELGGVPAQVAVVERLLALEQQLVHVPEPALQRGGLGRGRGGEGVRVDAGQEKCRNANRTFPASRRPACSIGWKACREYGHS